MPEPGDRGRLNGVRRWRRRLGIGLAALARHHDRQPGRLGRRLHRLIPRPRDADQHEIFRLDQLPELLEIRDLAEAFHIEDEGGTIKKLGGLRNLGLQQLSDPVRIAIAEMQHRNSEGGPFQFVIAFNHESSPNRDGNTLLLFNS